MTGVNVQAPKVLLRSPNWVGDAVMATPVPRVLKRTWPQGRVHVLARAWVAPVWERHPDVERILVLGTPEARARVLRRERYDLALVLPDSFSAAWSSFRSGARERVGYAAEGRSLLLTRAVPRCKAPGHAPRPQVYLNLARAAGADPDLVREWVFTLRVSPEELTAADVLLGPRGDGKRVGLAVGSVASSRRWPEDRYAALADRLSGAGHQVVLLGGPNDAELAVRVAARCRRMPRVLAGATRLREAIAVTKRLDLVVSNDSGAMHLAYAQGVPVLVLQGAADGRVTGPFGPAGHVLRADGPDCAPCVRNACDRNDLACMTGISLDAVWTAVRDLL